MVWFFGHLGYMFGYFSISLCKYISIYAYKHILSMLLCTGITIMRHVHEYHVSMYSVCSMVCFCPTDLSYRYFQISMSILLLRVYCYVPVLLLLKYMQLFSLTWFGLGFGFSPYTINQPFTC